MCNLVVVLSNNHYIVTPSWFMCILCMFLSAMFKWVAEYTRRTPWCYMLYEDTKVAWLFPENIDRLVVNTSSRFRAVTEEGVDDNDAESGIQTVMVDFDPCLDSRLSYLTAATAPRFSRMRADFNTRFELLYNSFRAMENSPPILLSGAPGIGKTVYVTKIFKQQKAAETLQWKLPVPAAAGAPARSPESRPQKNVKILDQTVDGSDDVFTRRSLRDELRRVTRSAGGNRTRSDLSSKTVLIIDEVSYCIADYSVTATNILSPLLLWCSNSHSIT